MILFIVLLLLFVLIDFIVSIRSFVDGGSFRAQQWTIAEQAANQQVDPLTLKRLVGQAATPAEFMVELGLSSEQQARQLIGELQPSSLAIAAGLIWVLLDYYGPVAVLIYIFFSGLVAAAAMGFTFTGFLRNRELSAMLSSGISMYRIATPVIVVGAMLSAVNLPLQEYLVPVLKHKLTRDKDELQSDRLRTIAINFAPDANGSLLSAARFDGRQTLEGLTIVERNADRLIDRWIEAERATWDADRSGWQLENGLAIRPTPPKGDTIDTALNQETPEQFFKTSLSPTHLITLQQGLFQHLLPIAQLTQLLNKDGVRQELKQAITRTIWSRMSMVVLNVLVLIIGLPFFMLRVPENMVARSLQAVGVCVGVWGGGILLLQLSAAALPPVAAAWLPVVILLPISAALLQMIKT